MKNLLRLATKLSTRCRSLSSRSEAGATAVEYGLMIALIALVIFVAVAALGQATQGSFQDFSDLFGALT